MTSNTFTTTSTAQQKTACKRLVIAYHDPCRDGQMAAYVMWRYLKEECNITPVLVPVNYSLHKIDPQMVVALMTLRSELRKEDLATTDLIILDFSFTVAQTKALAEKFRTVLVLDHHKTAIEDVAAEYPEDLAPFGRIPGWQAYHLGNLEYHFSKHNSGAAMAWVWCSFHAEGQFNTPASARSNAEEIKDWSHCPDCVLWTQDRDLWLWRMPETAAFAEGISLYQPFSPELYHEALKDVGAVLKLGELLLAKKKAQIDRMLKHKWPLFVLGPTEGGKSVLLALFNEGGDICSDLSAEALTIPWRLDAIEDVSGLPRVVLCYKIARDRVHVSLRSKAPYDCSWIARLYGGGGHAQACGFEMPLDQFTQEYLSAFVRTNTPVPQLT